MEQLKIVFSVDFLGQDRGTIVAAPKSAKKFSNKVNSQLR